MEADMAQQELPSVPPPARPQRQPSRRGRAAYNFTIRLTPDQRKALEKRQAATAGPGALGPWLVWCAMKAQGLPPAPPQQALARTRCEELETETGARCRKNAHHEGACMFSKRGAR